MTDEQIDHLVSARNAITDRTEDYINSRAVDHIDAVLRDVPLGQRADVDALLGRKRVVMVQHVSGAVDVAPGFDVTPAEMKRIAEDAWRNQPPIDTNPQEGTMTNELTVLTDTKKVNDLADRIAEFLPQSRALPKDTRLTIAQIALAHRLDPFLGDIWAIPERNKVNGEWQTTGYRIMIGISAWRRSAHDTGEYWGRRFEKCTDEERKWLGANPNDLAIKCVVMRRKTSQQPMEFDGYGIFKQGEPSKMNPLQCVRLRAERDALKGAFPIGFGGGAVKIGVADDTGEEINGDVMHGPKWDVITSEPEEPPIEQNDDLQTVEEVKAMNIGQPVETAMREPEAPAPEQRKTTATPAKKCSIKTPLFASRLLPALAEKTKYYNDGKDAPQPYHVLSSAAKCGYTEITADNVEAVLIDLVQHAIEQTLDMP